MYTLCKNDNLNSEVCERILVSIADFLVEHYTGQVIRFPKDFHYKIAQQNLDGTLKSECFYSRRFKDIDELERAIHDYIRYYNEKRISLS